MIKALNQQTSAVLTKEKHMYPQNIKPSPKVISEDVDEKTNQNGSEKVPGSNQHEATNGVEMWQRAIEIQSKIDVEKNSAKVSPHTGSARPIWEPFSVKIKKIRFENCYPFGSSADPLIKKP